MGRKPKFTEAELDKICDQIKKALAEGTDEKDLFDQLGISQTTFYEYRRKYPKLAEAITGGRACAVKTVHNAIYKAAVGYEYTEERSVARKDKNGERVVDVERMKKYAKPDMTAAVIWLRNHDPDYRDADKNTAELRKQEAELKRAIAEANNLDLEV